MQNLKKLYSCKAYASVDGMISYSTPLVSFETYNNGFEVRVYRYPSSTSNQHLRKYVQWLREQGHEDRAVTLRACLDYSIAHKEKYVQATYEEGAMTITPMID